MMAPELVMESESEVQLEVQAADFDSMKEAGLWIDPPNLSFGLGIPPIDEWPGTPVTEEAVRAACGDGRDYFRYWHRILRHLEAWDGFWTARERRSEQWYYDHCDWNQRLIMGIWGGGKSTIMFCHALGRFKKHGIPAFHNGGPLFGWFMEGDEIFTAMGAIPPCSTLNTDEAHMVAARRLGAMTSVGVMKDLGANIRRKVCEWDLATGHYKDVHPQILEDCIECLEAIKVEAEADHGSAAVMPWNDPAKFTIGWKHWGNAPFKNSEWRHEGLGDKYKMGWYHWTAVREAMCLNDSFGRNDWGTALLSDRDKVKEQLAVLRGDVPGGGGKGVKRTATENAVIEFAADLEAIRSSPDGADLHYITAGQVANLVGFDARAVGIAIGKAFGVKNVRDHGYPVDKIIEAYHKEQNETAGRVI